jgi:hypothetical protein
MTQHAFMNGATYSARGCVDVRTHATRCERSGHVQFGRGHEPFSLRAARIERKNLRWSKGGSNTCAEGAQASPDESEASLKQDGSSSGDVAADVTVSGSERPPEPETDVIELALAEALKVAAAAGDVDAIVRVADELKARRLARSGNVVDLAARKRGAR